MDDTHNIARLREAHAMNTECLCEVGCGSVSALLKDIDELQRLAAAAIELYDRFYLLKAPWGVEAEFEKAVAVVARHSKKGAC